MKKALLITGATSDLGHEFLKNLENKEQKIIALYNNSDESLKKLEKKYFLDIESVKFDLSNTNKLAEKIKELVGKYDIQKVLHLAAPVVNQERFNKTTLKTYEKDLSIQLFSIIEILKEIIPCMKKNKYGKIIIMLSSCTMGVPPKFWASYVVAKYSLLGLVKALAAEYSGYGIQINGISPSMMETKFLKEMDSRTIEMALEAHPQKRFVQLKEVVNMINFMFSDKNTFMTGNNICITGGEIF
ncbi:MAG: SDR family oxidoreductase [Fusobacteriaceae bacterium]